MYGQVIQTTNAKALKFIDILEFAGVDAVECDVNEQKVTVTGDLPPAHVLQRCRKCFKKATLL